MKYLVALKIAEKYRGVLLPYCHRCEIAGSIRRKCQECKDIEIVYMPDNTKFFELADIINQWYKIKGTFPCKYTQRYLSDGIKLDLFSTTIDNWGLIYALRTGSAEYSHRVLATGWVKAGYHSVEGNLERDGLKISVREEKDLFDLIGIPYMEPEKRDL